MEENLKSLMKWAENEAIDLPLWIEKIRQERTREKGTVLEFTDKVKDKSVHQQQPKPLLYGTP